MTYLMFGTRRFALRVCGYGLLIQPLRGYIPRGGYRPADHFAGLRVEWLTP